MNWENLLTTIVGLSGVLGGWEGIKYLINRKSNKRITESEADKKEIEADTDEFHLYKERLEEQRLSNAELNKQNYELIKACEAKEEIIADKTAKIRALQEARIEDTKRIGELEKEVQYYKGWKCFREYGRGKENCTRRKPAQNPPLKYTPLDDKVEDTD